MTTTKRSALGRGLGALIPGAGAARTPAPEAAATGGPSELPIGKIRPNPDQPRRHFDAAELDRLAESIRRHGVLQPVVVRAVDDGYELLVGERRWRAAQAAGLTAMPVVVADVAPSDRLEIALVENVQRHDLNPIELGLAFQALVEAGLTQEEIGARVGFERSTVANHLRLLDLPREMQGDVESGALSSGHAKAILGVANPERRRTLRDRILRDALSVRQAEELARELGAATKTRAPSDAKLKLLDPDLANLVDVLRSRLQTQVRLRGSASRGRIEIDYVGGDELGRIVDRILGEP
jgi:ParB family transcriptional regulator, chromosome partitioning protein